MARLKPILFNLSPLLFLALTASPVEAHLLLVRYYILPGHKVRIESFYSTSSPAAEAAVRVYRPNGELLLPAGVADEQGIYEFTWTTGEDLKIAVSQEGHRKEITIPATELVAANDTETKRPGDKESRGDTQRSHLAEILAGLSFIMAAAALFLSLRTASRLRKETG